MDIPAFMKTYGFNQQEFADLVGIHRTSITKHMISVREKGLPYLSYKFALRIEKMTDGEINRLEILYPKEFEGCERVEILAKKSA